MGQITIYLDQRTKALVKAAVKKARVSQSQWIADAIRHRTCREWPSSVKALAGAWPDLQVVEKIRKRSGKDAARERL